MSMNVSRGMMAHTTRQRSASAMHVNADHKAEEEFYEMRSTASTATNSREEKEIPHHRSNSASTVEVIARPY